MFKRELWIAGIVVSSMGLGVAYGLDDDEGVPSSDTGVGFYLGGQLGLASLHYSGSEYTSDQRNSYDSGRKFSGRAYCGYSFSQFIAAELGYDYYGYPKFKSKDGNTQDLLQQGMDLVLKASLPLDYGFSFYGKGGLAWIHRGDLHENSGSFVSKGANSKITPVGALGVGYWFAPNIAVDLSWTKTMSRGDLPTTDFVAVGLTYRLNF